MTVLRLPSFVPCNVAKLGVVAFSGNFDKSEYSETARESRGESKKSGKRRAIVMRFVSGFALSQQLLNQLLVCLMGKRIIYSLQA